MQQCLRFVFLTFLSFASFWGTLALGGVNGIKQAYFFQETWLSPQQAQEMVESHQFSGQALSLPDSKAIYSNLMTPSHALHEAAFGSYLIELEASDAGSKGLSVNINENYKIYLLQAGKDTLLAAEGELSELPERNSYRLVPYGSQQIYFASTQGPQWLLIHASAPIYRNGEQSHSSLGIVKLEYGPAETIHLNSSGHMLYQTICFGAFILLFLYQFAIYLLRREDYASLMLAATALVFLMRSVAEEQIFALFLPQSDALATFNSGIQFLRFVFLNAVSFLVSYFLIRSVFTRPYFITQVIMNTVTVLIVGAVLLNPNFPGHIKEKALSGLTLLLLSSSLLSVWLFYKAMQARISGAIFGFLGYIIGPTLVALDAMIILGKIDLFRVGTLGLVVLTFSFSLINGRQFAEAFRAAERLNDELTVKNEEIADINRNLEGIVEDRTRELKTIFHNIPQGVATLNGEGLIGAQYSRHLEQLLERSNLSAQSIFEVLFAKSNLVSDSIDRIKQTLASAVHEDVLSFELNADNLPREISRSHGAKTQYLALTWNPECDAEGHVHSILLTVEDVTDRHVLEEQAEKQRKDFEILQELVQCGAEKFELFSRSSDQLLTENMRLLRLEALSESDLKIIFVNTHTVKGGARTLGLASLATSLHDAEHEFSRILRKESALNLEYLRELMQHSWQAFNRYITYNRDKLGRKSLGKEVNLDLDFIKEHYRALKHLELNSGASTMHLMEQISVFKDRIAEFIYKSDTHIMESCLDNVGRLARDLGKMVPRIEMHTADIPVLAEVEMVIRNAMVHIIRNSMDHGLESSEERTLKGKTPEGLLSIRTEKLGDLIHITISDDGRGLALKKIKAKGVTLGLISENADSASVADLIFQPGLSTASGVSQISGRGVGMDAVRRFVEEAHGSISIELKGGEGDYRAFALQIYLPLQDINVSQVAA